MAAGGVERTTLDVAGAIVAAGGRALVATKGGRMVRDLKAVGATVLEGPYDSKNPWTIYANAEVLADIVRREKVAIVHARSRAPAWSAKWAAARTGAKFVTTYAGIYNARSGLKRWYNSVMASGDIVIANSAFTARHIRETYPSGQKPIAVIPRGIDLSRFDLYGVPDAQIAAMRVKWNVPAGWKVALLPGRISRWKGALHFVEAMTHLRGQKILGVLVGDAQSRDRFLDEVLRTIEALGLKDIVRYAGHEDEMPVAYATADVVISASIEPEAFGRVAVEAQAMRRLVVATNIGAAQETVLPAESGWLVPPADPPAMAAAIAEAASLTEDEAQRMRDRGRSHVAKRFTVEAMCRQTLAVYAKLLGGNPEQTLRAAE
jgi:glycosyltransferase involved in cell wall biosynthesis